ncbi:MAG: hypothetical protein ACRCZF_18870, partial [Gemmataceae bacterium]
GGARRINSNGSMGVVLSETDLQVRPGILPESRLADEWISAKSHSTPANPRAAAWSFGNNHRGDRPGTE